MKAPLVSVVIPARNRPAYLAQTLRSLRKQTFRDYELVLVDDASRPPLRGVLARSGVRPWTYVRHFSALGPAASRNDGLRAARGELIALLDSDDLWYPGKLAAQAACFRSPHVLFVHSNVDFIDGRGALARRGAFTPAARRRDRRLPGGLAFTSTVMFRRGLLDRIGYFDASFRRLYDDSDFWCRVAGLPARARRFLPRPLAAYRWLKAHEDPRNVFTAGPGAAPSDKPGRRSGGAARLPGLYREILLDQAVFARKRAKAGLPLDRFRAL